MIATNIIVGDCREILDTLPEKSAQCVVTSPPYWGQRDYGVDCMIGLEDDVQQWVDVMVQVFRKVRRVLRDDGTVWLNLGDKYAGSGGAGGDYNPGGLKSGVLGGPVASRVKNPNSKQATNRANDEVPRASFRRDRAHVVAAKRPAPGFKAKDLIGLPWRVAFALQADGWYLRSDIVWSKPNPMPESVTDRPSRAHEYIFLLSKKARYFYDADAVVQAVSPNTHARISQDVANQIGSYRAHGGTKTNGPMKAVIRSAKTVANPEAGKIKQNSSFADATALTVTQRNLRSVWTIPTQSFSGPHYATYPEKLVEPCIKAGTSEAGECPECGSPWSRVTGETTYSKHRPSAGDDPRSRSDDKQAKGYFDGHHGYRGNNLLKDPPVTTGWEPTCDHDAEPVPQTILDPFSGAGTTGLVAARFGRKYIGIELNPEYAEMSRKRIADRVGVSDPADAPADTDVQGRMI